jgi:hypothetical protein
MPMAFGGLDMHDIADLDLALFMLVCDHAGARGHYDQSPKQMLDEFEKQGDIDRTFAELTTKAPSVKQAEAKLQS